MIYAGNWRRNGCKYWCMVSTIFCLVLTIYRLWLQNSGKVSCISCNGSPFTNWFHAIRLMYCTVLYALRMVRTHRCLIFSVIHKEMAFWISIVVSLNVCIVMCLLGLQRFFCENGEYCVSHWLHQVTAWVPEPKHRDEGRPLTWTYRLKGTYSIPGQSV